jgi:hypothetical protein
MKYNQCERFAISSPLAAAIWDDFSGRVTSPAKKQQNSILGGSHQ